MQTIWILPHYISQSKSLYIKAVFANVFPNFLPKLAFEPWLPVKFSMEKEQEFGSTQAAQCVIVSFFSLSLAYELLSIFIFLNTTLGNPFRMASAALAVKPA